jgi:hypothetical protein
MLRELAYGCNVGLLGPCREPSELHIVDHPLTKRGHRDLLSREGLTHPSVRVSRQKILNYRSAQIETLLGLR